MAQDGIIKTISSTSIPLTSNELKQTTSTVYLLAKIIPQPLKQTMFKINVVTILLLHVLLMLTRPLDCTAFAAGKGGKGGKKKKTGGKSKVVGNRGFGISKEPPLEDVIAKFPTRIPENALDDDDCICPCGSGGSYKDCCAPFHMGEKVPSSPLDVLRSRYTAFAWRMVKYTMDTTHPTCRDYKKDKVAWAKDLNRDGMFDSYEFVKLQAGPTTFDEEDPDNIGYINFQVHLRANASNGPHLEGQEITVRELSKFVRSVGDDDDDTPSWSYASGEVTSDVAGLEDVKLNN